jgi:hypothetical protein
MSVGNGISKESVTCNFSKFCIIGRARVSPISRNFETTRNSEIVFNAEKFIDTTTTSALRVVLKLHEIGDMIFHECLSESEKQNECVLPIMVAEPKNIETRSHIKNIAPPVGLALANCPPIGTPR